MVYWTDSTMVLKWISSDQLCHKLFVGHRIAKIKKFLTPQQWCYCSTSENPADHASWRLLMVDTEKVLQWRQGPAFLPRPDQCPKNQDISNGVVDNDSFELATAHANTRFGARWVLPSY